MLKIVHVSAECTPFVKVGGCEANTDIYNCLKIGVNGIIAPMVETPFAISMGSAILP